VYDTRKRLINEFKIVLGGPMTHFFQAPVWVSFMYFMKEAYGLQLVSVSDLLWTLVPLSSTHDPGYWIRIIYNYNPEWCELQGCLPNMGFVLFWELCVWAVTINI
jgi:hypothetical protein